MPCRRRKYPACYAVEIAGAIEDQVGTWVSCICAVAEVIQHLSNRRRFAIAITIFCRSSNTYYHREPGNGKVTASRETLENCYTERNIGDARSFDRRPPHAICGAVSGLIVVDAAADTAESYNDFNVRSFPQTAVSGGS